jgi:ubiquinol-cytochrome c reductase cytochrome b subunit
MLNGTSRWLDQRLGFSRVATKNLNKVFPSHWTFMLGEVTLYSFVILLVTGAYLTFFFEPSAREVLYTGSYAPLKGTEMSAAYNSALHLSFDVRTGLVMRQMHHWSALLFLAAMVAHMMRVFFTGAFRRPREINWVIGVLMLILSMFNGLLGYSLLDDLLSGTGVRVAYNLLLSIPLIGPHLAFIVFGGTFPDPSIIPRFFVIHVLLLPAAIVGLVSAHLGLVWFQKHTQHRGPGRTEHNVVGTKIFPVFAMKGGALFFFVAAVIALLSGLVQINPIWVFGPFKGGEVTAAVTSAAQPDWYMGWLDGILRLIPGWETRVAGFEIPNYFWGAVVLPGIIFTGMMLWPFLEPMWTHDRKAHNILQKPRDNPGRTAFGAAMFAMTFIFLLAGSNDVLATIFHIAPEAITRWFRALIFIVPILTFIITKRICLDLQGTDTDVTYPGPNHQVTRTPEGGYDFGHSDHGDNGVEHETTDYDTVEH